MATAVECLLYNYEALSSNPSHTKKRKKKCHLQLLSHAKNSISFLVPFLTLILDSKRNQGLQALTVTCIGHMNLELLEGFPLNFSLQ
jgi:hypothetical protein